MVTLYARPLSRVEYGSRVYRIRASFDRVLLALDIVGDDLLSERDRTALALDVLVRGRHPRDPGLLEAILAALTEGEKPDESAPRTLDLRQDAPYIYAAFRQAYGINLDRERGRLHWQRFTALLQSLPSDTRMMEIIDIRTRELPAPTKTNAKERQKLLQLKARYRIHIPEAEANRKRDAGLAKMACALITMAKGGNEHSGR